MSRVAIILACFSLAGCSLSQATSPEPQPTISSAKADNALTSLPSSGLGPQTLLTGECGLFLWSQTDPSKFIFFSKAVSGKALVSQAEGPVELSQTRAGGDIFGQFNTEIDYSGVNGSTVKLRFEPGDDLISGQRISSGLLTTTDPSGWVTKLPVLGVRACQQE